MPNVAVAFTGAAGGGVAFTDAQGRYEIPDIGGQAWTITPRKLDDNGSASISSIDAVIALQTAVGSTSSSPERLLACDSSGDGRISAIDASFILQLRVGLIANLPASTLQHCGSYWMFIPTPAPAQNQSSSAPLITASTCSMGAISFTPLSEAAGGQDFLGTVFGDCDGSWTAPVTPTPIP